MNLRKIMSLGLLKKYLYLLLFCTSALVAEPITGTSAKLKLLDKTTNKVTQKTINVNSIIDWDSLNIQIYACYSTPPGEIPEDYVLLEIKDTLSKKKEYCVQHVSIRISDFLRRRGGGERRTRSPVRTP